ncbi:hypothetical protein [Methyloraptor flagellatus]|uniref:Uncharacterized protein n=1 Tax=Methyloraptor flagellatus TaxID=3162530 RepID=A0AAU7XBR4_9HYPH
MDWWLALKWLVIALAAFPIWGSLLWVIWDLDIRPRLIPKAAIEADAKVMLARWGERAAEMAFIEEDRAWRYSDNFQQGRWHRVRAAIERMTDEGV